MSVKSRLPILLIIVLSLAIIVAWGLYGAFYAPNEEISQTYTEIYQELEASEVKSISIDTITHNVEIRSSQEDKIRISYYQKVESSNIYSFEKGSVTLKLLEKGDELENLFYRSKRKLNTVVIYLPQECDIAISNHNVDGDLTMENVTLRSLTMNSTNGSINATGVNCRQLRFTTVFGESVISNVTADSIHLTSNSGNTEVRETVFGSLTVNEVTGNINVRLVDSVTGYDVTLFTNYGSLVLNNHPCMEKDGQTGEERETNSYRQENLESGKSITLTGIRNTISLVGDETAANETEQPAGEQ